MAESRLKEQLKVANRLLADRDGECAQLRASVELLKAQLAQTDAALRESQTQRAAAALSFPPPPAHQRFQERPSSPWVWCLPAAGGGDHYHHLLLPASTSPGHYCSRESVHVDGLNARLEAAEHFEDCEASTDAADLVLVELMEFAWDPAEFDSVEAREVVVVEQTRQHRQQQVKASVTRKAPTMTRARWPGSARKPLIFSRRGGKLGIKRRLGVWVLGGETSPHKGAAAERRSPVEGLEQVELIQERGNKWSLWLLRTVLDKLQGLPVVDKPEPEVEEASTEEEVARLT
ncbi:hypothetical protein TYRP_022636 [Tyrophagus putrescentiae]|nr:hypothetical protein TYRP_022636 [Tyrophagus putrescentiae]